MPELADLLGRILTSAMQLKAAHESIRSAPTVSEVHRLLAHHAEPLLAQIVEAASAATKALKAKKA